MGKGTILQHKGEGLYSVKLHRSVRHLIDRIAAIDRDLTALSDDITEALANREAAANALNVAQNDIDGKIRSINAKYSDLQKKIGDDKKAVSDAEEAVLRAQADVDYLKDLRSEGIEVTDEQMADAESVLATKKADLKTAKATLEDDQETWTNRDQDLDKIGELVAKGAEIGETYRQAEFAYQNLVLKRTALTKDKAWLTAKKKADPTVDAWCADLTTTLSGEVGTIEVPGERTNDLGDVQIRPGFDHRADYKSTEMFQNLIDALSHAIDTRNTAQDRYDAAVTALANGNQRVVDLQRRLIDLQRRPRETEDTYGYLTDADGNRIATAKGITEAEIVEAQGQLKAAQAQIPVLTDRKATMATALTASKAAAKAAEQALDAARTAEEKPRNADGLLQSVAAAPGPFSSFFNRTLLPAWEKWRPLYRIGEITELSGDRCTVKLDETKSSQQKININREPVLHEVPIRYMDCNGAAFKIGDRVIVEFLFHDQTRPQVIGFESNPRPCGVHGIVLTPCSSLSPDGWGKPITEDNAPWGTPGIAANHNLNLTNYTGPQGGVGTQALAAIKQEKLELIHGARWFSQVDVSGSAADRQDYAKGGFLGIKQGSDVWSTSGHWLPQLRGDYVVNRDGTVDKNTVWPPGVGDVSTWGRVDGVLYRNGKPHEFSNVSGTFVLGVGFHRTAATEESPAVDRMIVITLNAYTRTLYVQTSDPPYTDVVPVGSRHWEPIAPNTAFFVNASGTAAIGITLDLVTRIGKNGNPASFFEHVIHRITITKNATEATFAEQQGPGYPNETGTSSDEVVMPRDGNAYWNRSVSDNWNEFTMPIAVGYAGDVEKVLSVTGSYSIHSEYESFFWGVVSLGGAGGVDVYMHQNAAHAGSFDPGYIHDQRETSELIYDINGKTVATFRTNNSYRSENYAIIRSFTGYMTAEPYYTPQPLNKVSDTPYLIDVDFLNDVLYYGRIKQFFRFGVGWDTSGLIAVRDDNGDWHVPPVEVYANDELLGSLTIEDSV